jgi:hypothetical protein
MQESLDLLRIGRPTEEPWLRTLVCNIKTTFDPAGLASDLCK